MDNLSLLKLLGEALSKTKSGNNGENQGNSSLGLEKLAQLFQSFSNNPPKQNARNASQNQGEKSSDKEKVAPPPIPLQSQMLGTMKTHDDFIKRVLEKNPHD